MQMDEASAQLQLDLRHAVQQALATRRPLLHRLNSGSSWFLQIPRPHTATRRGARFYYNILIDPDFPVAASPRRKRDLVAITCVAKLEELARELEILASGLRLGYGRQSNVAAEKDIGKIETFLDAIVVSKGHVDAQNLLPLHPDAPVLIPGELYHQVTNLEHFRTVTAIPNFGLQGDRDWRGTSIPPLPDWLGVGVLPHAKDNAYQDSTLVITFNNRHQGHNFKLSGTSTRPNLKTKHLAIEPDEAEEHCEAIILSSSVLEASSIRSIVFADPALQCLAYIHSIHPEHVETSSCSDRALKPDTVRSLQAKYWIRAAERLNLATYERNGGFWAWLLQLKESMLRGPKDEHRANKRRRLSDCHDDERSIESSEMDFVELRAGESRVLH